MKFIKSYITVDSIIDRLIDEDKDQVECAYFSDVQYNDDKIEYTIVIDEEDENDDYYILEKWYDPVDIYNDRYFDYLLSNYADELDDDYDYDNDYYDDYEDEEFEFNDVIRDKDGFTYYGSLV